MSEESDLFGVFAVFTEYGDHLEKEAEVKEELKTTIKELEQGARDIHTLLQRVHRPGGVKETQALVTKAKEKFGVIQQRYRELDGKIPGDSYWKYCYLWSNTTSWISFLAALTHYLQTEKLATKPEVESVLGLGGGTCRVLRLDIEEYLIGLTHLSNELSRLSVNCVTSQDYSRPERIADFITSLNSGFRLLNLKNDNLRKKFDGIKYDLKKVEEVVYDLSIRGLNKSAKEDKDDVVEGDQKKEET